MTGTPRSWPENAWPTPEELADWLSRCTPEERIEHAGRSIEAAQQAAECFMRNHEGLYEEVADLSHRLQQAWDEGRQAGLRDFLAQYEAAAAHSIHPIRAKHQN